MQHPFPHGCSGSSFDGFEQLNLNVPWSEQRDDGDGIFLFIPFPPIVVVLIIAGCGGAVFVMWSHYYYYYEEVSDEKEEILGEMGIINNRVV